MSHASPPCIPPVRLHSSIISQPSQLSLLLSFTLPALLYTKSVVLLLKTQALTVRLSPTRFSHIQTFSLVGSCPPRGSSSNSLYQVDDSHCLSDWYPSRLNCTQVQQNPKATSLNVDPQTHLGPATTLEDKHIDDKLRNSRTLPRNAPSKTAGSAEHLCIYIHPQTDTVSTLNLDSWQPLR